MWLLIGLTAAALLITMFIVGLVWLLGRAEDRLDDGDPNNPYSHRGRR